MMDRIGPPGGRPAAKVILIYAAALAASSVVALAQAELETRHAEPRPLQEIHPSA